jgi:Subtilase family
MRKSIAHIAAQCSIAALAALLAGAPAALAAGTVSPLPASDYGSRAVCPAPQPGRASCLALALVPKTAEASARTHPLGVTRAAAVPAPSPGEGSYGLRPQDLHSAYSLPTSASSAQTVAIVDAYNDPNAVKDLGEYGAEFALPACTVAGGCFSQVNQNGQTSPLPFPQSTAALEAARAGGSAEKRLANEAIGWGLEISLDVETVHATCQSCRILLVEANSSRYVDLEAAEERAIALGATVVTNSWGGPEAGISPGFESTSPFRNPGVVITASAGDNGYLEWGAESPSARGYAEFPASSPHVVAVGGTRLTLNGSGGWAGESVWNGNGAGGGGCSVEFTAPSWQRRVPNWPAVGCEEKRAVADVAAVADPYTGLAVHDTSSACEGHGLHWCTIGGTSLASPLIAAAFALAGGAGGVSYPASTLYENATGSPAALHDVTSGSNGECVHGFGAEGVANCSAAEEAASCSGQLICLASGGYDGPSGVGTPNGLAAFLPTGAGTPEEEGEGGSSRPPIPVGSKASPGGGAGGSAPHSPAGPPVSGPVQINVTSLTLTVKALVALNRSRSRTSQVSFAFTCSAIATVRATLAKRVRKHRHVAWQTLSGGVTLTALPGRNTSHLGGRALLTRGTYRLTLAPTSAPARSLPFQIG